MKTLSFILIFFLSGFYILCAQDSLTVEEAVQRVLKSHPAIEQALANIRAAEARTALASSATLPEVITEATYARIGPVPEFSFPVFGDIILAPANNYDIHAAARYMLYDFGKTASAVDLSTARVQTSRDAMDLTKTNLSYQTIRVFYSIILLRKSLLVQDEQIESLSRHLSMTQKRVEAGTATSFDILTTQVRVATAQNQKVEILNSLQKQETILRQLLNLPSNASPLLRGSFEQRQLLLNADSLMHIALGQRTELSSHMMQRHRLVSKKNLIRSATCHR